MSLSIQMAIKKRRLIIRLKGDLDQSCIEGLKSKVKDVINKYAIVDIVFNLSELDFMDSSGIGFIIARISEVKKKGGEVIICQMNETIEKIYQISGLKRICKKALDETSADYLLGVSR